MLKTSMCLTEKIRVSDSVVQACITALLALSSVVHSQRYTLYKASLNRTTQKTRLGTGQLMKMLGPAAHRSLTLCFSWEQRSGTH